MNKACFKVMIILLLLTCASTVVADNKDLGERLAWSCLSCHGNAGASQGPATPVIAGLSYNYIVGVMLAYKYTDDLEKALDVIDNNPDLADVGIYERFPSTMNNVASALSPDEIKAIAKYFSELPLEKLNQQFDEKLAAAGKKLHKKYCDKCHENGGASTADDVGMLVGQWRNYLTFTMQDYQSGDRGIHKKMNTKLKSMLDKKGEESITQLIEYYSSQQ